MSGRVFYYSAAGGVSRRRLPGGLASPEPLGSESLGALLKAPRKLPRPPPPARRGLGAKIHREENETGCPPPAPPAKMAAPDPRASSSGRGCHGAAPPPHHLLGPASPPPAGVCLHRAGGAGARAPGETGTQPTATAARPPSPPGGAAGEAAWRWCWRLSPGLGVPAGGGSAGPRPAAPGNCEGARGRGRAGVTGPGPKR